MRSPTIWTSKPPCGTGVQLTKVRPFGQLPWNAWVGGFIVKFCPTPDSAFLVVQEETR